MTLIYQSLIVIVPGGSTVDWRINDNVLEKRVANNIIRTLFACWCRWQRIDKWHAIWRQCAVFPNL